MTGCTWDNWVELTGVEKSLFCSCRVRLRVALGRGGCSQAEETSRFAHTQVSQCCLWVSKMLYPRHGQGTGVQVKKMASKSRAEEQ